MSLINDLFRYPVEPGYYDAAERRKASGGPASTGGRPRLSIALMIGLALLGVLLTTAALQVQKDAGVVSAERAETIERINAESARTEELEASLAELQDELVELEAQTLSSAQSSDALGEALSRTQTAVGLGQVSGPGVVIELINSDDPDAEYGDVIDEDLRAVTNGLWAAGAEAISINGERVTPLTAIRNADGVILVNLRPIAQPYEVLAIGDPLTLPNGFVEGSGGSWLKNAVAPAGIEFSVTTSESLTLPGGAASLDNAQPKEAS